MRLVFKVPLHAFAAVYQPALPFCLLLTSPCSVFWGCGTTGGENNFWQVGHHTRLATTTKSYSTRVPQEGQTAECMAITPSELSPSKAFACLTNQAEQHIPLLVINARRKFNPIFFELRVV